MAKHMTQDDRKVLEARYNAGQSVAGIARAMSFNYSTIYKELKRGDTGKMDANGRAGYSAELGQQRLYNAKQRFRYRADCPAAMELFPDNYFDLAVVDPPYFSGPERRGFYGSKVSKIGVHRDYPVSPAWSKPEPEYFRELFRVCRHYIVWGCNYFDYQFATGRIVWDKCNGNSSFSDCEIAATNLFSSVRMFRYMWSGMMQGKSITEGDTMQGNKSLNEKRIHPTQKPVALYDWIFKNYAEPGQKILDTHLGSGSSRIAAYEAGLGFIGFEIDPFYFQLEEERFSEHTSQTSLFHMEGKKK